MLDWNLLYWNEMPPHKLKPEQRIFAYVIYVKTDSYTNMCRQFVEEFPGVSVSNTNTVRKLVLRIREISSELLKSKPVTQVNNYWLWHKNKIICMLLLSPKLYDRLTYGEIVSTKPGSGSRVMRVTSAGSCDCHTTRCDFLCYSLVSVTKLVFIYYY